MIDLEQEKARNEVAAKKVAYETNRTYFNALSLQQAKNRLNEYAKGRRSEFQVIDGDGGLVSIPEEYTTTAALQQIVETIRSAGGDVDGTLLYVCKVAEQALKAAGRESG
jgi:hypothetical protein